jgi:hypothetical protein
MSLRHASSGIVGSILVSLLVSHTLAQVPLPPPIGVLVNQGNPIPSGNKESSSSDGSGKISDEEALKTVGLSPQDGPKLIEYLKLRTLSDADRGKITGIIKRFGSDDFDDREKATEEIELYGQAAIGPLKTAERDSDAEVAYRARIVLKKMSKVPHSAVASAAVRAILKLRPEGATGALIAFLPLADDETVANSIRKALTELAIKDGKVDPTLIAALTDASPVRRSAAYTALIFGGPAGEGIKTKDVYLKVKEAVLKDNDIDAKFTGLWFLLQTTREKDFLPELIGLIPQLGRGRIWQLEDLLLQTAGSHPKDGRFLKSPDSLIRTRDAWLAWWKAKSDKVNFAKFEFKPRLLGVTDVVEMDTRGFGQARVVSLGPDLKEKWRIANLSNPNDALSKSDDRVVIIDGTQITERSVNGTILSRPTAAPLPLNIQSLPEGNLILFCRGQVVEFNKDWQVQARYIRPNGDIMTGVRLPQGDIIFVTNAFQGANAFRLDSKLKDTTKTYTFGRIDTFQAMDAAGDEKIILCERDRVAEYDLTTGKQTWRYECDSPTSCQRLANGNTLISLPNASRVIEVDPSGETVWEYESKDGLRAGRARRR